MCKYSVGRVVDIVVSMSMNVACWMLLVGDMSTCGSSEKLTLATCGTVIVHSTVRGRDCGCVDWFGFVALAEVSERDRYCTYMSESVRMLSLKDVGLCVHT